MSPEVAALLVLFLAITDAGIIPVVEVLQGPSSKTTLVGPDGSTLAAAAPGGTLVTGVGVVAGTPLALAAGSSVVVAGPAGTIATSHTLAGPAVLPAAVVLGAAAATTTDDADADADATTASPDPEGDTESNDGAYVPDKTEQLYDDGSYKENN